MLCSPYFATLCFVYCHQCKCPAEVQSRHPTPKPESLKRTLLLDWNMNGGQYSRILFNVSYSSAWAHGSRGCYFPSLVNSLVCWVFSMDREFVSNMKTSCASFCVCLVHVWYLSLTMPILHHQLHMVCLNLKYYTKPDKVLVVSYALETRPFGGRFCEVKSAGVNPVTLMSYVRIGLHCSTQQAYILLIRLCLYQCSLILLFERTFGPNFG